MTGMQLDNNYAVSQRVGFISLPLGCLVRLASLRLLSASTTADAVRAQVARIFSQIFPWGTWWSAASLLLLWVTHLLIHPLSSSTLCCTMTSLTPLFCYFRRDSCAWPCASGFCEYSSSPPAYESPGRHRHQAYAASPQSQPLRRLIVLAFEPMHIRI
jgi:hypothetical protein